MNFASHALSYLFHLLNVLLATVTRKALTIDKNVVHHAGNSKTFLHSRPTLAKKKRNAGQRAGARRRWPAPHVLSCSEPADCRDVTGVTDVLNIVWTI